MGTNSRIFNRGDMHEYNITLWSKIYTYFWNTYKMDKFAVDDILERHRPYNTVIFTKEGFARFNVIGTHAHVIDCVGTGISTLRELCKIGKERFPNLEYIVFERGLKKRNGVRTYLIDKFIKEGE